MLSFLASPIDTVCLVPVPAAAQPGKRNGVWCTSSVFEPTVACGRGPILPRRQKGRRAGGVNFRFLQGINEEGSRTWKDEALRNAPPP